MNAEALLDLIRAIVLLAILLIMVYSSRTGKSSVGLIFFSLAAVSLGLSFHELYV